MLAASLVLFGTETWTAFLTAAAGAGEVYAANAIFMSGLTSPYGALMALGAPRGIAFAAQGVVILFAALVVGLVWRRAVALPPRAAILLAATPVAVPVLMFYDLMLVLVALVWLNQLTSSRASWETPLLAAVFLGPLLSGNLSTGTHWVIAAVTAAGAFALVLANVARTGVLGWSVPVPVVSRPA